ncbi:MAG TPA: hypothetical protein DEB35_05700 [Desulfuromonas sp.]|nr:hypothetical protein [Desulfuromonas sp.]
MRHLKDPHPAVRVHAVDALGNFFEPKLVPYLVALFTEGDDALVSSAAQSLGRLGFVEAEAPLLGLLQDSRAGVRRAAVEALGRLGG